MSNGRQKEPEDIDPDAPVGLQNLLQAQKWEEALQYLDANHAADNLKWPADSLFDIQWRLGVISDLQRNSILRTRLAPSLPAVQDSTKIIQVDDIRGVFHRIV